ncbi:hypothetical protein HK104_010474 [Borealophlyctis nickersoniae]|nr:hypothetical protein HK104_010474 [Borealophlyctis nickersoniae]
MAQQATVVEENFANDNALLQQDLKEEGLALIDEMLREVRGAETKFLSTPWTELTLGEYRHVDEHLTKLKDLACSSCPGELLPRKRREEAPGRRFTFNASTPLVYNEYNPMTPGRAVNTGGKKY